MKRCCTCRAGPSNQTLGSLNGMGAMGGSGGSSSAMSGGSSSGGGGGGGGGPGGGGGGGGGPHGSMGSSGAGPSHPLATHTPSPTHLQSGQHPQTSPKSFHFEGILIITNFSKLIFIHQHKRSFQKSLKSIS